MSIAKGYPVKCRDPRCSLDCLRNWRQKEASILRRFVAYHLPTDVRAYRGHLRLPDGSTPADHSAALTKLFRGVKRIAATTGNRVELYAIAHITAPDRQHWDIVACSDAPKKRVRRVVRRAWQLAGGGGYSLRPIHTRSEKVKAARYATKDTATRTNPFVHLPARGTPNLCRYTSGFWAGQTKDGLWRECIEAWFGHLPGVVSNKDKQLYDTLPNDLLTLKDHLDREDRTEADIRLKAIRLVHDFAPRTPTEAIAPTSLSRRVSVKHDWFTRLQPYVPGLCRTPEGRLWCRRPWDAIDPASTPVGPDPQNVPTMDTETPTEGESGPDPGTPGG